MNQLIASTSGTGQDLKAIITAVYSILTPIIPIIIGLAFVYFLLGVIKYIKNGGNEKDASASRDMIIYGILGIFVMLSVWGLLAIITTTFFGGSGTSSQPSITQFVQTIQGSN